MNLIWNVAARAGTVAWLVVLAGCYQTTSQPNYGKLGLVEISGVVTLDGQPLGGAAVFFHDRENRRFSYGVTDADGKYSLMFDSRKSGVLPGEKEVEITTTKNPFADPAGDNDDVYSDGEGEDSDATPKQQPTEKVPSRYNSQSELRFRVTQSDDSVDFELVTH